MDPEYYDRKAAEERKKAADQMKKRGDLEKQAAEYDGRALKDDAAARSASSESTRRSKQRSAENHRKRAAELRKKAAAAAIAAAKHEKAANKAQSDTSAERARREKRAADKAKRDARDAQRDAERQQRERAAWDRQVASDLRGLSATTGDLHAKTEDLAAAIDASRRAAPEQITVLLIAGTPEGGTSPLRLDREARETDANVQASRYRDQINLEWIQATRVGDLISALNRFEPDVVHFSGHGNTDSLLFESPDGTPRALDGADLALLLQAAPRPIRLMVFNACRSAQQAEAATDWSEFAIGMEHSIGDEAAKEWAGQFYGSLASGVTVALAFKQATAHATVLTSVDAPGAPQLFENATADAAATVLVSPASPSSRRT